MTVGAEKGDAIPGFAPAANEGASQARAALGKLSRR